MVADSQADLARPKLGGGYKAYALGLLVVVYVSNFIDRTIVGIVAQPMKEELGLADWQLGLLSGLAFALFYTVLGLPIARLAERRSRVSIIAIALAVWSLMTAVCGLAQTFTQLLLARVGVGVGEAGCSPAAQSLIADYYPPESRATALSIYSLGIPIGSLFGAVAGGWIAQELGWRAAFMLLGLPGLALALLVKLTLKEPVRGGYDLRAPVGEAPSFGAVMRTLFSKPAFIHVALGGAMASFAGYGIGAFTIPFLLRGFDISLVQASSAYGLVGGLSAALGTGLGGWLADRTSKRSKRSHVLIPAVGLIASAPLYVLTFAQTALLPMALLIIVPAVIHYFYLGPTWGLTSNMVESRMRATATAILLLIINLIGLGLGPTVVGGLSDLFAQTAFGAGDYAAACPGGRALPGSPSAQAAACRTASFEGVKHAIMAASLVYVWAGLHYLRAGRTLTRDLEVAPG
ncbi:MAG: MFS transporter [Proteobacteria bacterium]|nr:MFS transporter [Pseudomonadota bacterium]